jgi:hypothetical protein
VEETMDMREDRQQDDDNDDFYLLHGPMEQQSAHPAHSAVIYLQLWHGCNATFLVSAAGPTINVYL